MRRLSSLLLIIVVAVLLSGCQSSARKGVLASLWRPQTLRVGMAVDAPPLAAKKKGQISGLEWEFAQGLAQSMQRSVEVVELERADLAQALLARKVDIVMAGMPVAEAQRLQLAATESYLISGQVVLVHLDAFARFGHGRRNLSAEDVRLGVVEGSAGDRFIKGLNPKGNISRFPNGPEGLRALLGEQIDVFIHDFPANGYFAALFVDKGLTPGDTLLTREPLAWAVHPKDTQMREAANAYLAELRRTGELEKMLERNLPFYRNTAYSPKQ